MRRGSDKVVVCEILDKVVEGSGLGIKIEFSIVFFKRVILVV